MAIFGLTKTWLILVFAEIGRPRDAKDPDEPVHPGVSYADFEVLTAALPIRMAPATWSPGSSVLHGSMQQASVPMAAGCVIPEA